MAVDATRISGRLRALFPKANLSTTRLNEISGRLSKMPADDADDAAIDAVINQANEYTPFSDIARADDKIRDLESKVKPPKIDDPKNDPLPDDLSPAMKAFIDKQNAIIEGLATKIGTFEQRETQKTVAEKFTSDARVKDIPAFIRDKYIPADETKLEDAITELTAAYTPYAEANKIAALGNDTPLGGILTTPVKSGEVNPAIKAFAESQEKK